MTAISRRPCGRCACPARRSAVSGGGGRTGCSDSPRAPKAEPWGAATRRCRSGRCFEVPKRYRHCRASRVLRGSGPVHGASGRRGHRRRAAPPVLAGQDPQRQPPQAHPGADRRCAAGAGAGRANGAAAEQAGRACHQRPASTSEECDLRPPHPFDTWSETEMASFPRSAFPACTPNCLGPRVSLPFAGGTVDALSVRHYVHFGRIW